MKNKINKENATIFEQTKKFDEKKYEYWSARDLGKILEYSEYRHFKPVIEKAKEACENSGQKIEDHFEDFLEMVDIGSGAKRPMEDGVKLSRYACYLIVQNADPGKEVVAQGQTYFAIQTRLQEIRQMDENSHIKVIVREKIYNLNEINTMLRKLLKQKNLASSPIYSFGRGSTRAVIQKYNNNLLF